MTKKYAGRLPAHLTHLKTTRETPAGEPERASPKVKPTKTSSEPDRAQDRLTSLLPVVLQAMVAPYTEGDLKASHPSIELRKEDVLAALDPYYRPNSRFEQLIIRKLVGENLLRPRGGRDKHGFSEVYVLTPKGEKLAGVRRSRR